MTTQSWLLNTQQRLNESHSSSARLDALVLLEDVTEHGRAHLLAHPEMELTTEQIELLGKAIARRVKHEPLAYIRGHSEFYGRRFLVDHSVLVPRPESETIIDLLLDYLKKLKSSNIEAINIADIGTGSGALAITAALETDCSVSAVDIDEHCLAVSRRNAALLTTSIDCIHGNLLEPFLTSQSGDMINEIPTILLCNLPYVPRAYPINKAAGFEPALALYGGEDGLDIYRALFAQAKQLWPPEIIEPTILTESLPEQHLSLIEIANSNGFSLHQTKDFVQVFSRL